MHSIDSTSEIAKAVRAERHARKLGERRQCVRCEERRPAALPSGPFPVAVCRNCLAKERWQGPEDDGLDRKCEWCPENHPATMEWHHIYGRATRPDIGCWLCKNCHAVATALQLDGAVSFDAPASAVDYVIHVLRAEAVHLVAVDEARATLVDLRRRAEMYADMADRLTKFREALRARLPGWENIPEAKP